MRDELLDTLRHELAEPLAQPGSADLRAYSEQVVDWLWHHHATLPEQEIGRTASRAVLEGLLGESPPETGQDFSRVLAEFQEKVAPFACRIDHPRFLAFIPAAPTYVSKLGDWLCAGTNFFASVWLEAAGPAQVELVVLDWFRAFLGMPAGMRGLLTSGGSEANLTGLLVARERLPFAERARAVLYLSEQRHRSVDRAARIIGLRPDQLRAVAADAAFRLNPARLEEAIRRDRAEGLLPWVIVANAGATNTGTVDPLAALADVAQAQRLWLHVDAAYGWPAVLTPEGQRLLDGIARADSVVLDPHKWFGQTYEAGCLLVRQGRLLTDTFAMRPDYMQDVVPTDDEINFADHGLALTRRFRALKIWLSIKVLGVRWFRHLVARCCRLADLAQLLLERTPGFEILSPRQLSILCFRYRPPACTDEEEINRVNLRLVDESRATGRVFLSSTRLNGRVALRFCFVNWRTTAADVEEIVQLLAEVGGQVSRVTSDTTRP